jgi:MerR family mercuric resistance operon transcriptional regulator
MDDDQLLKIGDVAEAAGVPRSTIRYYERAGLLWPVRRTESNYRQYNRDCVERLRFIKAAQASGFTLDDIRGLCDLAQDQQAPNRGVQQLIEQRISQVEQRLQELQRVRDSLQAALRRCRDGEGQGCCPVLEHGEGPAAGSAGA